MSSIMRLRNGVITALPWSLPLRPKRPSHAKGYSNPATDGAPPPPRSRQSKPLRVFAALAAAKTGLDGRGGMGSTVGPQLWNFQVERLDVGVMASPETGWEA